MDVAIGDIGLAAIRCAIVAALAVLPGQALAGSPNYAFVEVGHIDVAVDEFEIDDFDLGNLFGDFGNFEDTGDGTFFSTSYGGKLWHAFGEYRRTETADGEEFGQRTWWVGAGWHGLLGEQADLVAEAAYVDAKVGTPLGDAENAGVRLSTGVRFLPIGWFEMNGFYNYVDIASPAYGDSWEINLLLKLWLFRLGAGYERFDGAVEARVFARYTFE